MTPGPGASSTDRRAKRETVREVWSAAQRDAWRLEGFKMQVAQEMAKRRNAGNMRRAILIGVALGIAGCGIPYFL
jgi:hypothetical protein